MSEVCKWLHEQLEALPVFSFPFDLERLPRNGIYFFYEKGEVWAHGGENPRIVRIGTSKDGNFRSRIGEHFLLNEKKMQFDASRPAPHERSIFRKNLGRALLTREGDPYLKVWEIDFTSQQARKKWSHSRNIGKEQRIEAQITQLLRETFSFRFITIHGQQMGKAGLESRLIGTVAQCEECRSSESWLGRYSPKPEICAGKLWLVQHLKASPLSNGGQKMLIDAVSQTAADLAHVQPLPAPSLGNQP
jgi:hypothetical protein